MKSSKIIDVSKASLISLKAELSRKQEEVNKAKAQAQSQFIRPIPRPKKQTIWTKKNAGVTERDEKDAEEQREEEDILKKSRAALEAKSKLYDKLSKDSSAVTDDKKFLVDFHQKASSNEKQPPEVSEEEEEEEHNSDEYENPADPEEEWVDYDDCLGRRRRCLRKDLSYLKELDRKLLEFHGRSDDKNKVGGDSDGQTVKSGLGVSADAGPELLANVLRTEQLRQKWEQQEEALRNKTDIHYQDVLFDEARSHGVGYYAFSQDEAKRHAEQEALLKLRQETEREQEATKGLREKRQKLLEARLKAARQRKRARLGLPPEEEKEEEPEKPKEETEEEEEEKKEKDELKPEPKRKVPQIRPWDIGKEGVKEVLSQEEWVEKKRFERPEEFAPPSSYQPDFIPDRPEELPKIPKPTLFFSSKKPKYKEIASSSNAIGDEEQEPSSSWIYDPYPALTRVKQRTETREMEQEPPPPGTYDLYEPSTGQDISTSLQQTYGPIVNECDEEDEDVCGKGQEVPPPPTYNYYEQTYGPIMDECDEEDQDVRGRGQEIPPPPTYDYYGPSSNAVARNMKRNTTAAKELESSIVAGLKYLRQQAEEKKEQREKGLLLDII